MADDGCCDGFFVPDGAAIAASMSAQLACVVDSARNVEARLGQRPYTVTQVWTRWTGTARGDGVEEVVRERVLLPVPLIVNQGGVTVTEASFAARESGDITIKEVSPRLLGTELAAADLAPNEDFYYEVRWFAAGERAPIRRRYALTAAPVFDPRVSLGVLQHPLQQQPRNADGTNDAG